MTGSVDSVTLDDVAKAHAADLEKHGVVVPRLAPTMRTPIHTSDQTCHAGRVTSWHVATAAVIID